jgi:hypothetical protein
VRWTEFAADAPRLAEVGVARLVAPGVLLVGTIRADGRPRISPVEPLLWRDDLWLSMMLGSRKAADLARDSRLLVHNVVTGPDGGNGEFKIDARAISELDHSVQGAYAERVATELGWDPTPGRFHLFRVDLLTVSFLRYDSATGDQFVTQWPARREFVRRGTGATEVGPPEPWHELLR